MKKIFATSVTVLVFAVCCLMVFNASAATMDISSDDVRIAHSSYVYTGSRIKPRVTVTVDGAKLVKGRDYTVTYYDNKDAGDARIVVDAMGEYSGSVEKSFRIKRRSLDDSDVRIRVSKAVVNGNGTINATYAGKKMYVNKDYRVSDKNLAKVGKNKGQYVFVGKGNFKGSITVKCNVYPKKVTGVSVSKKTDTTLKLKWKSQKEYGVTGYKIYTCDKNGNNAKYFRTVSTNSITVKGLTPGQYFHFYVRAYKVSGDSTLYGDFNKMTTTCTKPQRVTVNSVTASKDGYSMTVNWQSVPATGYQIKYSSYKNFDKNVRTIDVKGGSKSKKKIELRYNQKYYVKVRAYRRFDNGKKVCYGPWSVKCSNRFSHVYSSFSTTYYGSSANRCTNIRVASKMINGTILAPGEEFSFDAIVGKRTADKGFKEAPIFLGATGHGMSLGGGICQVASTMFNAALYGNFRITERHQHSQRVTYVALGRDAALNWGTKNFRFRNDTDYPVKISLVAQDHHLTCKLLTSTDVKHKKVELKVSRSGNTFTLRRYAAGKVNYTTTSTY